MNKINLLTDQDIAGICGGTNVSFGNLISTNVFSILSDGNTPGKLGKEEDNLNFGKQVAATAQSLLGQ